MDSAFYSRRERDLIGRYVKPWRADAAAGVKYQAALSWDQVRRFKDRHDLPLILKGIATAEDAEMAVRHGVEVIYVSNHGGRQLDHGLGSAAVLPEVVAAVGGRAEVWVDGGFMRGSDVVKAIALGARCVGLGRLACLGLAAAGVAGLVRALELMEEEIRTCLGLLGVTSMAELTPAHIAAAPPVFEPAALSAFPLLGDICDRGLRRERGARGGPADLAGPGGFHEIERRLEEVEVLLVFGRLGAVDLDPFPRARHAAGLERDDVVPRELQLGRGGDRRRRPTPSPEMQANILSLTK